jgi:hypothetical protein
MTLKGMIDADKICANLLFLRKSAFLLLLYARAWFDSTGGW